jgi:Domain of unknown function (DUF1841)
VSLFAGQDREALRGAWRSAWQRHLQRVPLEPLQSQMVDLIAMHPEYQPRMSATAVAADSASDAAADSANSFLHLALHMALREQLATDRPAGIAAVHRRLRAAAGDTHPAEHRMIEVLAQVLWEAQRAGRMPDEQQYLEALRQL